MKEEFLNYIWQQQYYNKDGLTTEQGHQLQIISPGTLNTQAGPDFHQSRILLNNQVWVGEVEIHIKSSEWYLHQHHQDAAYDQVILHVVWSHNREVRSTSGQPIPTLVLRKRVKEELLLKHQDLQASNLNIPCELLTPRIDTDQLQVMLQRTIKRRMERRSAEIFGLLQSCNDDWDQVAYLMYGKSFGFFVNDEAFKLLVRRVPLSIVRKIRSNLFQLEALYFGQAGLLAVQGSDSYYRRLQSEYHYLAATYRLPTGVVKPTMWKFLRLRPANFPSVRIAQFAAFMQSEGFQFSFIREVQQPGSLLKVDWQVSDYWQQHYFFGKQGGNGGKFGRLSLNHLIINVVAPILAAYATYAGRPERLQTAMGLLRKIPAEQNHIITYWKGLGFKVSSAFDSQALLELYHQYCSTRRCLECDIGKSLLT